MNEQRDCRGSSQMPPYDGYNNTAVCEWLNGEGLACWDETNGRTSARLAASKLPTLPEISPRECWCGCSRRKT